MYVSSALAGKDRTFSQALHASTKRDCLVRVVEYNKSDLQRLMQQAPSGTVSALAPNCRSRRAAWVAATASKSLRATESFTTSVDAPKLRRAMATTLDVAGPVYVRLAKGGSLELRGVGGAVPDIHAVKQRDLVNLITRARHTRLVDGVEEHSLVSGLSRAVTEPFADCGLTPLVLRLPLPDRFSQEYGSQGHRLQTELTAAAMAERICDRLIGFLAPAVLR